MLVHTGKRYFNFINSLRSEATKKKYDWALRVFLEHYKLTSDKLAETDPEDIEALIIDYIVLLKSQKKSYSLMGMMTSAKYSVVITKNPMDRSMEYDEPHLSVYSNKLTLLLAGWSVVVILI